MLGVLLVLLGSTPEIQGGMNRAGASKPEDILLSSMQQELQREGSELGKLDPAPYYTSYSVYEHNSTVIMGSLGSLVNSSHSRLLTPRASASKVNTAQPKTRGDFLLFRFPQHARRI